MDSAGIRKKFLDFFARNGHAVVPSSSLIPDDPSVLLTTAGMQQFKRYYTGELDPMADFKSKNTASIQKSFRTSDIDAVGDESHLTFFEMLGNFSFGGYWKKEAIKFAHDFITKEMGLPISYVTVFKGSDAVPKDNESRAIWRQLGIADENIREEGMEDVFWGPTGTSGPCGPTTEIYCKNEAGKDVEIWNVVFNEFLCDGSRELLLQGKANLAKLGIQGIDTGMGMERLAMISQQKKNIFETDLFAPFRNILSRGGEDIKSARIIADHLRGSAFLIADGVVPSSKGAGYILRRLIRRAMIHANKSEIQENNFLLGKDYLMNLLDNTIDFYAVEASYSELALKKQNILGVFEVELDFFNKTIKKGLREFQQRFPGMQAEDGKSGESYHPFVMYQEVGKEAFDLYQSYGFPLELIRELLEDRFYKFSLEQFMIEFRKHQEKSRTGAEKKFGGHGLILDTGELKAGNEEELKKVLRLHTATHLLQRALRDVLGPEVHQLGSDITPERTRFDFPFPRKLTPEEIARVEALVNEKIKEDLPVQFEEMSKEEAEKVDALHFFREKYPDRVKVYFVGHDLKTAWSKEFCGGPHVTRTGAIGQFRIAKEEAVGQGVRRVRGVVN